MSETEELKPCPFCGANAEIVRAGDEYEMVVAVNCTECSAHVRETDDTIDRDFDRLEAQAVAAWNKRANSGVEAALRHAMGSCESCHHICDGGPLGECPNGRRFWMPEARAALGIEVEEKPIRRKSKRRAK